MSKLAIGQKVSYKPFRQANETSTIKVMELMERSTDCMGQRVTSVTQAQIDAGLVFLFFKEGSGINAKYIFKSCY